MAVTRAYCEQLPVVYMKNKGHMIHQRALGLSTCARCRGSIRDTRAVNY